MSHLEMPPITQPDPEGTRTIDFPVAASSDPTASLHYTGTGPGATAMNWGTAQAQKTGTLGLVRTNDSNLAISGLTVNSFYIVTATWRGTSGITSAPNMSTTLTSDKLVYGEPSAGGIINQYNTASPGLNGGPAFQYTVWVKANATTTTITTGNGTIGSAYIVDLFVVPALI